MNFLVVIISVINITNDPIIDSDTRSIYDNRRRTHDTLKTIFSIKELLPTAKILLIECSEMHPRQEQFLGDKVDYFYNLYNDIETRNKVNSNSKTIGEIELTLKSIEYLKNNNINYDCFFKINGRYWLNPNFNKTLYENDLCIFGTDSKQSIISSFYKLSNTEINNFKNFLISNRDSYEITAKMTDVLSDFSNTIEKKEIINDKIGIYGFKSSNGEYCNL
jgi:hypothetical protein